MRIILIGYGKMGKVIEKIALNRGHEIVERIDVNNGQRLKELTSNEADVAIEFTQPESAYVNTKTCIEQGIPVVSGTTGWLEKKQEVEALCKEKGGAFFYASNYSVGVNLFFQLNKYLARMMKPYTDYKVNTEEIHHTEKKDAPSGTSITLAEGLMETFTEKTKWVNEATDKPDELPIISLREHDVKGTHTIQYLSAIDDIEIKHTAHTREGFASGAVMAAEWVHDKQGVFGMADMLNLEK